MSNTGSAWAAPAALLLAISLTGSSMAAQPPRPMQDPDRIRILSPNGLQCFKLRLQRAFRAAPPGSLDVTKRVSISCRGVLDGMIQPCPECRPPLRDIDVTPREIACLLKRRELNADVPVEVLLSWCRTRPAHGQLR